MNPLTREQQLYAAASFLYELIDNCSLVIATSEALLLQTCERAYDDLEVALLRYEPEGIAESVTA